VEHWKTGTVWIARVQRDCERCGSTIAEPGKPSPHSGQRFCQTCRPTPRPSYSGKSCAVCSVFIEGAHGARLRCDACERAHHRAKRRERWRLHPTPWTPRPKRTLRDRFEANVERVPFLECWVWTGRVKSGGYGEVSRYYAHRVAYELYVGPIPAGLHIDHLCMNKWCVNPNHLEPVTLAENTRRWFAANPPSHCRRGHPWTQENRYVGTRTNGKKWSSCLPCKHDDQRRARAAGRSKNATDCAETTCAS
jgi:hypothetical protein